MRDNHLSVTTLEEYEPNREFVGRNFNAGEVIQLVLRAPRSGRWLPFAYVQMVMMHELAHCAHMNHSRAFWAVRNAHAESVRALWRRGYTGEGIWGRGALLGTGAWEGDAAPEGEELPEHLCGGTFRSRAGGKRKKPRVSYAEQKERRIRRKFGVNGAVLGEDEGVKRRLEGKRVMAKPRVAGSARGRELRAAAALARFEVKKEEVKEEVVEKEAVVIDENDIETASEAETESGDEEVDATEVDGRKILDGKGGRMVKVCEDEDANDADVKNELSELQDWLGGKSNGRKETQEVKTKPQAGGGQGSSGVKKEGSGQQSIMDMLGAKKVVKREPRES